MTGISCPKCGSVEYSETESTLKNGTKRKEQNCRECRFFKLSYSEPRRKQ